MSVIVHGPALAATTCARRLAPLGSLPAASPSVSSQADDLRLEWDGPDFDPPLHVDLSWYGPAEVGAKRGSETAVQAMTGLMQLHGHDAGGPRRIGIEVASVVAGMLAANGVLAAALGRSRGWAVTGVQSSVLQAGLLLVLHRVAADSAAGEWVPAPAGAAPGPPFRSADGAWFEIETLDPLAWKAFWERLGAGEADLGHAWKLFRPRYLRGTCTLPRGLHEATAALPLEQIDAAAQSCAVSLRRVREYHEVLADLRLSEGHPVIRPRPGQPRARTLAEVPPRGALPLTGVRVVEATSRVQGPLTGLLLRMLGAQVVRVEPPGGDPFRTVPPLLGDAGSFFLSLNDGKEAVELDLGTHAGRDDLQELVAGSDVFLHNWRPGKAAEWHLEAHEMAAVNPSLVYGHASGWGDRADLADVIGTDFLVQAHAGLGAGINPEGTPPVPSRALLTDYAGALVTCEAVLAGLYARQRTGRGQYVEASLLAGATALQAHVLEALARGTEKGRRNGRPLWGPLDRPLRTADGVIAVTVDNPEDLRRMCQVCHVDPDQSPWERVEALLAERIAGGATARWEKGFTEAGIASAEVCTDLGTLPREPKLAHLFAPLRAGASVPRPPWRFLS